MCDRYACRPNPYNDIMICVLQGSSDLSCVQEQESTTLSNSILQPQLITNKLTGVQPLHDELESEELSPLHPVTTGSNKPTTGNHQCYRSLLVEPTKHFLNTRFFCSIIFFFRSCENKFLP